MSNISTTQIFSVFFPNIGIPSEPDTQMYNFSGKKGSKSPFEALLSRVQHSDIHL